MLRLVKTSLGNYEVQVRSVANYRHIKLNAQVISANQTTITYATSPVNGSTNGDIYMPLAYNVDNFSNLFIGGSIGIGTTTPSAKLDVRGNPGAQTTLRVTASNGSSVATGWPTGWSGLQTWDIIGQNAKLNGGIQVAGDMTMNGSNGWIFHTPDDGRSTMYIAPTGSGGWNWNKSLILKNNGDMTVNGTITASTPTATNHVATKDYVDTKRDNKSPVAGNFFTGTPLIGGDGVMEIGKYIDFHNSNTTTSDYTARLRNEGSDLILDGGSFKATSFLYTSDERLKKDIYTIKNPLEKVLSLRGVEWNWKDTNKKDIGLIAQEVEKIYPELVNTDEKGYKSVQYGNLVGVLIESIKEQQKIIDKQKLDIENINIRLEKLENK